MARYARRRSRSVQAPWLNRGWSTDEYYAARDRVLDKNVEAAGKGINPYGYYTDRPGLAISPMMHNPYFSFAFGALSAWAGWFLFGKLSGMLWLAIVLVVFFNLGALVIVVMGVIRVPGWHRARKVARAHIAEHGGALPSELRWYT